MRFNLPFIRTEDNDENTNLTFQIMGLSAFIQCASPILEALGWIHGECCVPLYSPICFWKDTTLKAMGGVMYKYNEIDKAIVQARVDEFRSQVERRLSGTLPKSARQSTVWPLTGCCNFDFDALVPFP